jgi:hypothetical protein
LLRARLFPATVIAPKTAVTHTCLEAFELLSYESKITAFKFYRTLTRLTDNTQVNPPKVSLLTSLLNFLLLIYLQDRYLAFLRVTHEWRHLKMLKRAGRGHDPERTVAETLPGECAVLCPACPQIGKNMPDSWENEPPERQLVITLPISEIIIL